MEFMMIVKASKDSEAGVMPSMELMEAMGKFNQELVDAGVLIHLDGLQASSKGARIQFFGGKRTVVDGPFAETKEIIAGFWIIRTNSKQEAIDWALRAPAPHGEDTDTHIEVRQVFEPADFGAEMAAHAEKMVEQIESRKQENKTATSHSS